MAYVHDLPENRGVMNGIKRAKQLSEICWDAAGKFPICVTIKRPDGREFVPSFQIPGFPVHGIVYSSTLKYQKFVGYNVSFETFLTAARDRNSLLYRQNLHFGERANASAWYGTVCSELVNYAWDLHIHRTCADWSLQKDVLALGQPELDDLRLLDAILNTHHIATVTDIIRDEQGHAVSIEVTEATLPYARKTYFDREEFTLYWYKDENPYQIFRRQDHSGTTYTPLPFVHIAADPERGIEGDPELPPYRYNDAISPDYGNKANYLAGDTVRLDLLSKGWTGAEVEDEDGRKCYYPAVGGVATVPAERQGFFKAYAVKADGTRSELPAEWAVVGFEPLLSKDVFEPGEPITVHIGTLTKEDVPFACLINGTEKYSQVRRFALTDEMRKNGSFVTDGITGPGEYCMLLFAENRYGVYTSRNYYFHVRSGKEQA